MKAPELIPQTDKPVELTLEDRKCGFGIVSEIKLNFNYFTLEQQNVLKSLLQRKVKQKSMVSPSGFFRIHYDTTGTQTPIFDPSLTTEENVYQVALAADSSYNFEVNFLEFPHPPQDNGEGGDDRYDIYITTADDNYGFTQPETQLGNERYTSFMEIHFSFANFPTTGLAAMKVTIAHEFHHSIQMGNYVLRLDDRFFYELTSTSMEEFVYDDVNDYYYYIPSYFNNPQRAFPDNSGYNLAHWNIFIQKKINYEIIKRQWELLVNQRAIIAISSSLLERNSTFARELNVFGIWTYYTGFRAIPNSYFEEAEYYPLIKPLVNINYPQYSYAQVGAKATSNNFVKFNNSTNTDTLVSIVTNGDVYAAIQNINQTFDFTYTLYSDGVSGTRKLTDNYSSSFSVDNPNWWAVSEILNGIIVREDSTIIPTTDVVESFAFPNPFRYSGNLSVSIEGKQGEPIDFNVYSSDMSLIYSSQKPATILINNTVGISWNGLDKEDKKLSSGVYIYVIKQGDEVVKGKVVIFNE